MIQIASDPLFAGYPIRGFPSDLTLGGAPRLALEALADAAARVVDGRAVAERRRRWETEIERLRDAWAARAKKVAGDTPIDMAWVSRCIADRLDDQTIVVNEYDLDVTQAVFRTPGTYFGAPPSGGLGWGLGASLGAKLAARDKSVVCCVGDGAYIFGSPTAAHWVSRAYDLPVLFVVFNNRAWNAVKRAVTSVARDGWAARTGNMVLSDLDPAPEYQMMCQASGGYGEKVEDPAELPEGAGPRAPRGERREAPSAPERDLQEAGVGAWGRISELPRRGQAAEARRARDRLEGGRSRVRDHRAGGEARAREAAAARSCVFENVKGRRFPVSPTSTRAARASRGHAPTPDGDADDVPPRDGQADPAAGRAERAREGGRPRRGDQVEPLRPAADRPSRGRRRARTSPRPSRSRRIPTSEIVELRVQPAA